MGVGIRAYARRWGVRHRTIQFAIERGIIVRLPDGTIDPEQADASWGEDHLARMYPPPEDPEWAARIDRELAEIREALPPWTDAELDELMAASLRYGGKT